MRFAYDKKSSAYFEGVLSIIVNIIVSGWKLFLGLIYQSVALMADAFHSLFDIVTSIVLIYGFYMVSKPPDKEHPYGHGRAELISTIIIGSLLLAVSFEFLIRSGDRLLSRQAVVFSNIVVYSLVIMAIIKELLAQVAYRLADKYGSDAIRADGYHHRSDAIATILLAIGILLGKSYWWLDGVLGLVISLYIMFISVSLIRETSDELLGRGASEEEEKMIKDIVTSVHEEVTDVHHIHLHKYGDHVELTLHVRVPKDTTVEEADRIAKLIENAVRERLGWEATVHVEGEKTKNKT